MSTDTLPARLKNAHRYIRSLWGAAHTCWYNLAWLHANGFVWIPLIDFDVICGTLPIMEIHKQAEYSPSKVSEEWLPYVVGPHTVAYLFHYLSEYCLPPGTVGEMLDRKKKLLGGLSGSARQFLRILNASQKTNNPLSAILKEANSFDRIGDILITELERFSTQLGQLETLEFLLGRDTPVQTLIGERMDERNTSAFRHVHTVLNTTRPNKSVNNFFDALNVATTVRIFNAPSKSGRGRRIPALISQTNAIVRFGQPENVEEWLDVGEGVDIPIIFNSVLYFIIQQALLMEFDGNYSICANEANILARHLSEIECYYLGLIRTCKELIADGRAEESISADDLPVRDKEMLQQKLVTTERRWGTILTPACTLPEHDRIRYMKLLLTPRVRGLLTNNQPKIIRQGVKELEKRLRTTSRPDLDLWQSLIEYRHRFSPPLPIDLKTTIILNHVPSDGTPLRDLAQGPAIKGSLASFCQKPHDIRLAAFPRFVSHGAVLVVDSWFREMPNQKRFLSVVWVHDYDAAQIWNEGCHLLSGFTETQETNTGTYRVFSADSKQVDGTFDREAFPSIHALLGASEQLNYFEIQWGKFTFFADVEPMENKEFQAGLVFPKSAWNAKLKSSLIEVIWSTNWLHLDIFYYEEMLQSLLDIMGVHAPAVS